MAVKEYLPFWGLLLFGNIENLVLACQGAVIHVDPVILGILTVICVSIWFLIGTVATQLALKYSNYIEFAGGLIIFILGLESVIGAVI